MLARLKSLFNPGDESRLLRRIFWTGFLVRVLYMTIAHTYRFRVVGDNFEFGWEMGRIARALATGYGFANPFNGLSGPTAWTPPLYPLILAGVFKLFGVYTLKSGWVILTINSVFSAATATAIYQIAWRCFGRGVQGLKIALWSAWLWALYPAAMQYAVKWVWDMSLTAFLFAWVLVVALRLRGVGETSGKWSVISGQKETENGKLTANPSTPTDQSLTTHRLPLTTLWLLFGLLWGLIALSNSSLLTFLPACGLWAIWPNPGARSRLRLGGLLRSLIGPALAALCFAAVISPWAIRNWEVFHAFVPMRSNFGAELYEATIFSNDGFPWGATLPMSEKAPEFRRYERIGEVEFSRQQGERAKAAIYANPGHFAKNALRRIYFFWISVPHALDAGIAVEAIRRVNFAFFSFSGFLGLALALRRHIPGAWLFFWAFAVYPTLYYFITVQARFRHPLEPIICILSVYLFQSADRTRVWSSLKPRADQREGDAKQ
jgi:4-amino-4-deoxy-L-arabinose transferase-like glycosyltransferase